MTTNDIIFFAFLAILAFAFIAIWKRDFERWISDGQCQLDAMQDEIDRINKVEGK